MSSKVVRKTFAGASALVLAGCGFALGRFTESGPAVAHAAAAPPVVMAAAGDGATIGRPSFAALVEHVSPAVVHIKVTSMVNAANPFADDQAPGRPGPALRFRSPCRGKAGARNVAPAPGSSSARTASS